MWAKCPAAKLPPLQTYAVPGVALTAPTTLVAAAATSDVTKAAAPNRIRNFILTHPFVCFLQRVRSHRNRRLGQMERDRFSHCTPESQQSLGRCFPAPAARAPTTPSRR